MASEHIKPSKLFRERIVARYYSATSEVQLPDAAINVTDSASVAKHGFVPRPARDTSLTAFAQLGALRLNASRALISLLGSKTQYILAEATQSLSLQSDTRHGSNDNLWLGAVAIPVQDGMGGVILDKIQRADSFHGIGELPEILVINDLREVKEFAECSWIVSGPRIQSAVGAPLSTSDGTKIGMFLVCYEYPCPVLTQEQKTFLRDMSKTIMNHLDAGRIQAEYKRRDELVNGLESFIDGLAEIRTTINGRNHRSFKTHKGERIAKGDAAADGISADPDDSGLHGTSSQHSNTSLKDSQWESALPPGSRSMFSRASKIIRQAGHYDGVIFFYVPPSLQPGGRSQQRIVPAKPGRPQDLRRESTSSISSRTSTDDYSDGYVRNTRTSVSNPSSRNDQDAADTDDTQESAPCPVLAYEFSAPEAGVQAAHSYAFADFTQLDLKKVFGAKPKGRVLVLNDRAQSLAGDASNTESSIEQSLSPAVDTADSGATTEVPHPSQGKKKKGRIRSLLKLSPRARSFTILPLHDFERQRWFTYCICWSSTANRDPSLDGDLHYLRIFGNSIMNALSHIDALAADRAKTSFVSSVSHELRSPLHGILGANNFLSDSELTRFQEEMVESIQSCGHTLLDTLDHVMDFAKISAISANRDRKDLQSTKTYLGRLTDTITEPHGLMTSSVNLVTLIEEVVEAIYMGVTVQHGFLSDEKTKPDLPGLMPNLNDTSTKYPILAQRGSVRIALDLPNQQNPCVQTRPGAWRRIMMNLFANSLKYTSAGLIIVQLEAMENVEDSASVKIVLTVKDTGRGISNNYLQNHLFRPFSQEDSFSPGTGLGLSIVSQIVHQMGGSVDVSSSKGIGTIIKVDMSIPYAEPQSSIALRTDLISTLAQKIQGLKLCLLEDTDSRASVNLDAVQRTSESRYSQVLLKLIRDWFKVNASISSTWTPQSADIIICLEPSFKHLASIRKQSVVPPVIFIAYDALEMATLRADARITSAASVVEIISQPVGPRKITKALARCVERKKEDKNVLSHAIAPPAPHEPPTGVLSINSSPNATKSSHGLSVLICDDNPINLRLLGALLHKEVISYTETTNGQEAFESYTVAQGRFNLVFMDISMPVMDGITASRLIRKYEREHSLPKTAIIALTGLASAASRSEAEEAGIDEFLTKPIDFNKLRELLKTYVQEAGIDESLTKPLGSQHLHEPLQTSVKE